MLPRHFSPTGAYSETQLDRARGYRLLVHAEIEAYLEDRALTIVQEAYADWKVDMKPRHVITCLVGFCRQLSDKSQPSITDHVGKAYGMLQGIIRHNHGITEDHILGLVLPIGIDRSKLDPVWLTAMTSFGRDRGEIAHRSAGVQISVDPQSEYRTVQKLLPQLLQLDEMMNRLHDE